VPPPMAQDTFTFTAGTLRLEECKCFVTLLAREEVRVGPWVPLWLPLTPPAQSSTKSLLISNQAFDSGIASLKSQLSSVVSGAWVAPVLVPCAGSTFQ